MDSSVKEITATEEGEKMLNSKFSGSRSDPYITFFTHVVLGDWLNNSHLERGLHRDYYKRGLSTRAKKASE